MTNSRILFCFIEYKEYPEDKSIPQYHLVELNKEQMYNFMLMFGNGLVGECRFECETFLGIDNVRALTNREGNVSFHPLSDDEKQSLWLYQIGDECYVQAGDPLGYVFINPIPHPEKFEIENNV